MKKSMRFLGIMLASFFALVSVASASSTIEIESNVKDIFGEGGNLEYSYNEEDDVIDVLTTVTVDDNTITKLLSQVPTAEAYSNLGIAYSLINPVNIGFTEMYKQNKYFAIDDTSTIEEKKQAVRDSITPADLSSNSKLWPIAAFVQYSTDNGVNWNRIDDTPDGNTSVGSNLLSKLGLTSYDELVYGENFRIGMYENFNWLYLWQVFMVNLP